jgi:hypothetical protein
MQDFVDSKWLEAAQWRRDNIDPNYPDMIVFNRGVEVLRIWLRKDGDIQCLYYPNQIDDESSMDKLEVNPSRAQGLIAFIKTCCGPEQNKQM